MNKFLLALLFVLPFSLTACGDPKDTKDSEEEDDTPADTDGDGISDEDEIIAGTDPNLADTDTDGINDPDEAAFGTDPLVADTDADGLTDGEELALGSDGTLVDTDSDTYSDYDESVEGTDPADPESRIYIGYWPYNPDKDSLEDPGWTGNAVEGGMVPRFEWVDQYGDMVDVYDYAGHGKYMIIDLSAMWCGYCHDLADWLGGDEPQYLNMSSYEDVRTAFEEDRFYWIELIDQNANGGAASATTVAGWHNQHPIETVPVLADENGQAARWMDIYGYPTLMLVDENMVIVEYNIQNYMSALASLKRLLAE